MTNIQEQYTAAEKFVDWLERRVVSSGRGDCENTLEVEPSGKYWLGRLAPEEAVIERQQSLGERGERLDPCAVGMRLQPAMPGSWQLEISVSACAWTKGKDKVWHKLPPVGSVVAVEIQPDNPDQSWEILSAEFQDTTGYDCLKAEIRAEIARSSDGRTELTLMLVNISPVDHTALDTNLYECTLRVSGIKVEPFLLEAIPDSFRYDRRVEAYGINCGIERDVDGAFVTTDTISVDRTRPIYWGTEDEQPNFGFEPLFADPLPTARQLLDSLGRWGENAWSEAMLKQRGENEQWNEAMFTSARQAAEEFREEHARIARGVELLASNPTLLRAFKLMNRAMLLSAENRGYDSWRPFQLGFLLANLNCIVDPDAESEVVDIVWFATGGGKTETYLGLLITAALYDRMTGKISGITAWSRFPLRMLSLQQTQRFADAMAGAERVRREEKIAGAPFSVGFFVGSSSTPNAIPDPKHLKPGQPDADDDTMPARYQVLMQCPFCHQKSIEMAFDRLTWQLAHRCTNDNCFWPKGKNLPFYIVDEETYRFLPTVVVGTLDKAASISMQAAMRGLVGAPLGKCSENGHGYTYAPRSNRPHGCLVPGCRGKKEALPMDAHRFGPSFRLQDELHLLKDSLGAVDSHYEALYDSLQMELCGRKPKILASSATLSGYEKQVDVLYRRSARVFPLQGPTIRQGFWTTESEQLMRRFVAIAPRGLTLEFTMLCIVTEMQNSIRFFIENAKTICNELGIAPELADFLISVYGTDVVYGNTLKDIDAIGRSADTMIQTEAPFNTVSLTGRSGLDEVMATLNRLDSPEPSFDDRLHLITASSMMSHGVDVNRLNVMAMLGIPLTTSEFIQATARVGRRWPGLVFVVHKIARERDASVYRSFRKFVEHGDRFVEPIPITRHSRQVLKKTIAGIELARILMIHEPASGSALTKVSRLRQFVNANKAIETEEIAEIIRTLRLDSTLDQALKDEIELWFEHFFRNLHDPGGTFSFISDLSMQKPMRSLRDVEEQAPVHGSSII